MLPTTHQEMSAWFSSAAIREGERAWREGRAVNFKYITQTFVDFMFHEDGDIFNVRLQYKNGNLHFECRCKDGRHCKHAVAGLFALGVRLRGELATIVQTALPKLPEPQGLSPAMQRWLTEVAEAGSSKPPEYDNTWPTNVRDRLVYVVSGGSQCELVIQFFKGRLNRQDVFTKDGWQTWNGEAYRRHENFPLFISSEDRRLWLKATEAELSLPAHARSGNLRRSTVREILDGAIATGRCRLSEPDGVTLRVGSRRKAMFSWSEDARDGSMKLSLKDQQGSAILCIMADQAMYADPVSGEFGELESDVGEKLLTLLAQCPTFTAMEMTQVVESLRSSAPRGLPQPPVPSIPLKHGVEPQAVVRIKATKRAVYPQSNWRFFSPDTPQAKLEELWAEVTIEIRYDGAPVRAWRSPIVTSNDGPIVRNASKEQQQARLVMERLVAVGFKSKHADATTTVRGDPEGAVWQRRMAEPSHAAIAQFLDRLETALSEVHIKLEVDESWPARTYSGPIAVRPRMEDRDGFYEFDIELEADARVESILDALLAIVELLPIDGLGELPEAFDMQSFLRQNPVWHTMASGQIVRLPPEVLAPMVLALIAAHNLRGKVHKARAAEYAKLVDDLGGVACPPEMEEILELGRRLRAIAGGIDVREPPGFVGELRGYQRQALGWMAALAELELAGCLADDMGLGKTVVTCAYLADRHLGGKASGASLVMAPASMVWGWERELTKFSPTLRIGVLHGGGRREVLDAIAERDVVITSYKIGLNDIDALESISWDSVVLDEAHRARNRDTKTASMIRRLEARARFALTGTPVNNHLEDLWTAFDWLIPGLLGARSEFKDMFRIPIEREGSKLAQARLNEIVRPFMLRRTKKDVATELPAKTEIIEPIRFGKEQRALYESTRVAMLAEVKLAIAARGIRQSRATILTCLLRLRQICCDPKLLKLQDAAAIPSAKLDRLVELAVTRVAEGGRIVIFTQFVGMMTEIGKRLDAESVGYFMLWGKMPLKKRLEYVDRFQKGEKSVFIVSLHAGGEGITVTAADTVVLYDCWWSPTAEMQAQDRVHRIGQEREVFVYRLIAENSVEEGILEVQRRKQDLADAIWSGADAGQPFDMSEEDVYALFGETRHAKSQSGGPLRLGRQERKSGP